MKEEFLGQPKKIETGQEILEKKTEGGPESSIETEEELEQFGERKIEDIDMTSQDTITSGEERVESAIKSVGASEEMVAEIEKKGGFVSSLRTIGEKVKALAISAKDKIENLLGKKGVEEVLPVEGEVAKKELVEEEAVKVGTKELTEKAEKKEKEKEEIQELYEYLEREVYQKLGISLEDQERTLAEVSPEKREILEQSFQNIRATTETYFELETIEGKFNEVGYLKELNKIRAEKLYPLLEDEITKRFLDYKELVDYLTILQKVKNSEELNKDEKRRYERQKYEIEFKIENQIEEIKSKTIEGENTQEEYKKRPDGLTNLLNQIREINTILLETKPFHVRRSREEVLAELLTEKEKVEKISFITINIGPDNLERIIASGRFKGLFDLDEKSLIEHAKKLGDISVYIKQRKITEKALDIHMKEGRATIYGAYGSKNGFDDRCGGAEAYGSLFLKLKPEVLSRTVFCEGDSLTTAGFTPSILRKLGKQYVDRGDWETFARKRQISLECVPAAKAIFNLEKKREEQLKGRRDSFGYIEAHITAGLQSNEIESVNVSKKWKDMEIIRELLKNPEWVNKINIIED